MTVPYSDTYDIPNIANLYTTGTTTSTSAGNLVNTSGNFVNLGVKPGDVVFNTTTYALTVVSSVTSATTLALVDDIMLTAQTYSIFQAPQNGGLKNEGCLIYIGNSTVPKLGTELLKVMTVAGDVVTLAGLSAGQFVPLQVIRVYATTTTAGGKGYSLAIW
jgi:hypothetical protein